MTKKTRKVVMSRGGPGKLKAIQGQYGLDSIYAQPELSPDIDAAARNRERLAAETNKKPELKKREITLPTFKGFK